MSRGRRPATARAWRRAADRYLESCDQQSRLPTVTGLALALGFPTRAALETAAGPDPEQVLIRALSQVEEANLQAVYRRDTASGAKFILQSCFGYGEKDLPETGPITVQVEGEEEPHAGDHTEEGF